MNASSHTLDRESGEIDRVLKSFKSERQNALRRQLSALDKYDEEMKEIGDLDDIDRELYQWVFYCGRTDRHQQIDGLKNTGH